MRIVVECTELVTSMKTGVYSARLGILCGMLEHLGADDELVIVHRPAGQLPELPPARNGTVVRCMIGPEKARNFPRTLAAARQAGHCWPIQVGQVGCGTVEAIYRQLSRPFAIRSFIHRLSADIFFSSDLGSYGVPGAVTVSFLHDMLPLQHPEWFTEANRRNFLKKIDHVLHECDVVLTNSERTRQDALECLSLPPDRCFVTPLAAGAQFRPSHPGETFEALDRRWKLAGRRVVLCVGTVEPRKNLQRLMHAVEKLQQDGRFGDVCLVICGSIGWKCDAEVAQMQRMEAEGRLVHTGFVSDAMLARLYRRADVFAFISLYEGFGLPLLEAFASGTAAVCSSAGALPEVAGGSAVVVDPFSISQITNAIRLVLEDAPTRDRLRQLGLDRAGQFSWPSTGQRVLDVLRWACGRGPRPETSMPQLQSGGSRRFDCLTA